MRGTKTENEKNI